MTLTINALKATTSYRHLPHKKKVKHPDQNNNDADLFLAQWYSPLNGL